MSSDTCPVCTGGAGTGVVCDDCLNNAPMRRMFDRQCLAPDCGYAWTAGKATGACPKCHDADPVTHNMRINALKRL